MTIVVIHSFRMRILSVLLLFFSSLPGFSQKQVAITMDDIEQRNAYLPEDFKATMLDTIIALDLPVTIFISEGRLFADDSVKRFYNIERWVSNPLIHVGSHTYSHLYYSDTTFSFYTRDIERGLAVSAPIAHKYGKTIRSFRFPFNCLGKDSLQHHQMLDYFAKKGMTIAPFSVESEDWAYNTVYEHYLSKGDTINASATGHRYVTQTLAMFHYLEKICQFQYNRDVRQIYLCHDNLINEHYLPQIIRALRKEGYETISFDKALADPVYQSADHYYKKWGISWIYRYNYEQLKEFFKQEPNDAIYREYEELMNEKNK